MKTLLILSVLISSSAFADDSFDGFFKRQQQQETQRKNNALTQALTDNVRQQTYQDSFGRYFDKRSPEQNTYDSTLDIMHDLTIQHILKAQSEGRKVKW